LHVVDVVPGLTIRSAFKNNDRININEILYRMIFYTMS